MIQRKYSVQAKSIMREAYHDGINCHSIICLEASDRLIIQVGRTKLYESVPGSDDNVWKNAIDELVKDDLISGKNNQVYNLTPAGKEQAEKLEK